MNTAMDLLRSLTAALLGACSAANAIGLSPSLRATRQASEFLAADSGDTR